MSVFGGTITITFGDQAENDHRMEKIGIKQYEGFSCKELKNAKEKFELDGFKCEYINLSKDDTPKASILIIRNFVKNADKVYEEQQNLTYDKHKFLYGEVRNSLARHNICFSDNDQSPDIQNKKGTIVSFNKLPLLKNIRISLEKYLGKKAENLVAEGNHYYDIKNCGIGYHGDAERSIVIALRLGDTIPLHYQWYHKGEPQYENMKYELHHGDMYIMSEKATGNDWKKKNIYTLRHAAGSKKYTEIKIKNKKKEKKDKDDKILNPATGRWVNKSGKIGKALLEKN